MQALGVGEASKWSQAGGPGWGHLGFLSYLELQETGAAGPSSPLGVCLLHWLGALCSPQHAQL